MQLNLFLKHCHMLLIFTMIDSFDLLFMHCQHNNLFKFTYWCSFWDEGIVDSPYFWRISSCLIFISAFLWQKNTRTFLVKSHTHTHTHTHPKGMLTIRDVTAVKQVSHRASFVTSKFLITLSFVCHYKSKVGTLPIMNLCVHISSGNKNKQFLWI